MILATFKIKYNLGEMLWRSNGYFAQFSEMASAMMHFSAHYDIRGYR